jgi:hypothetical protein
MKISNFLRIFAELFNHEGNFPVSGLTGVGYSGEPRLTSEAFLGQSTKLLFSQKTDRCNLPRPANAVNGTIPQKADCGC